MKPSPPHALLADCRERLNDLNDLIAIAQEELDSYTAERDGCLERIAELEKAMLHG